MEPEDSSEAVIRRIAYTPILAHDGEHGLSIFGQQPQDIDLVLADGSVPNLDGIEMVRRMVRTEAPLFLARVVGRGYLAAKTGSDPGAYQGLL